MLSTAMHWRIKHIEAELLICRSPALICNYIFSAVFMYFWRGFLCKKRWVLGQSSTPRWGSLQRSPTLPSWVGRAPTCTLPGTARPLLHPTPCHTLTGAPPPLPIPGSTTAAHHQTPQHCIEVQKHHSQLHAA